MKTEAGDVYWLQLDPTKGREQQKTRLCLVMTRQSVLGLASIVPITDAAGKRASDLFVAIPSWKELGFEKPSMVDTWQIRCVDVAARVRGARLCALPLPLMDEVRRCLANILGIEEAHLS